MATETTFFDQIHIYVSSEECMNNRQISLPSQCDVAFVVRIAG